MASPLNNSVLYRQPPKPGPGLGALKVMLPGAGSPVSHENGATKTEQDDGSVLINLNPSQSTARSNKFDANIAMELPDDKLNSIASDLLRGIELDDQSRTEWLETHAEGIKLLGLIIEDNRGDVGTTSAPLEGMSRYYHPLLLEAVLLFQANARGELLPAAGPMKVRDDQTEQQAKIAPASPPVAPPPPIPQAPVQPMPPPGIGHNGGPPLSPPNGPPGGPPSAGGAGGPPPLAGAPTPMAAPQMPPKLPVPPVPPPPPPVPAPGMPMGGPMPPDRNVLAQALEKDFNHYLTVVAQEYYPDTDQMFFKVGFGGQGVKKVYNCPLRRRPVSESIDIKDFIVSNALTDLGNAARITHRSKMRPSTFRRLQLLGVYRDINVGVPTQSDQPTAVDQVIAEVQGVQPQPQDPRDADYTILECCCELDLDEYAPRRFKGKGLPLPYRVTIEKDSRKIVEIRRNWKEDDQECMRKEYFVEFPYVKAFGFYGVGLSHILGNTTKAVTAICREMIDAGMFANFPGFIYAKGAGRQMTNQFRVPPGGGIGLDIGLQRLQDAVMPLPYKSPDVAFTQFEQHLEQIGQRIGGTANTNVGEGRQDAPVGTTLALLEQATKPVGAVLKRLHAAQSKEFQLLKERFREDPEAFWRFNKKPAMAWQKEQFIQALNDFDLIPVADPNNPTALHRAAKANALQQMAQAAPMLFDLKKVVTRIGNDLEIDDIESLLTNAPPPGPPGPPPPDPAKMAQVQATVASKQADLQAKAQESQMETHRTALELQDRAQERQHQTAMAQLEQETERMRLASTLAIHSDKTEAAREALHTKLGADAQAQAREHYHDVMTTPPPAAAPEPEKP